MTQLELRRALKSREHQIAVERRLAMRRQALANRLMNENEHFRVVEERIRTAQHAGGIGTFDVDVDTGLVSVSDEFCRIFGLPVQPVYSASALEQVVHAEDQAVSSDPMSRRSGEAQLDVEYRIRPRDGCPPRWVARRARFVRNEAGAVVRMVGVIIDITETRRRDERAAILLALGDRLRNVASVAEAARVAAEAVAQGVEVDRAGYASVDHQAGCFVVEHSWAAPDVADVAGRWQASSFPVLISALTKGDVVATPDLGKAPLGAAEAAAYADFAVCAALAAPVISHGDLVGFLFAHCTDARPWTAEEIAFAAGVADRTYATLARIGAESQQRVLNHELAHRLKNTLAIVQAIASQTLKHVAERDTVDAFTQRLRALSVAHDALLNQSWSRARMREIVSRIMAIHSEPGRVIITGPDLPLGPQAGLSLSLVLHELATNALKYGALSNACGTVEIVWDVSSDPEGVFTLTWRERGGPRVVQPSRKGFGSRLIGMGIGGGGEVEKHYHPDGFFAVFRTPAALIHEVNDPG